MTSTGRRDIVVIAASAGGVAALQGLVKLLPEGFPATVLVVTHLPAMAGGALPKILQRAGRLAVAFAEDGEPMEEGRIYVAPPNRHLLLYGDTLRLSYGARQHSCRPAADPLFFSAALSGGPRTIGVVLSGTLDDGAAGCAVIERHGGLVVVQDLEEAGFDGMPRSALAVTTRPLIARIAEIAKFLEREAGQAIPLSAPLPDAETERRVTELLDLPLPRSEGPPGTFTGVTCPECGGPIYWEEAAVPLRFECRMGHSWSARTLLEGQAGIVERALSTAARQMEEGVLLTRLLARQAAERDQGFAARRFEGANKGALRSLQTIRELLYGVDQAARDAADGDDEPPIV
jgi:two-component system chemotaxis response regulator CheB